MKCITLWVLLPFLLLGSLLANIYIHEYGHFVVADHYELEPEMHFEAITFDSNSKLNFYSPAAYTSYSSHGYALTSQDMSIAFAGPLFNLFFALFVCGLYLAIPKKRRTFWLQAVFAVLAIPAFASFAINMMPLGYSDGAIILSALLG